MQRNQHWSHVRRPIGIHRAIIALAEAEHAKGNALSIRSAIRELSTHYTPETVRFAVHGLADGRVRPVWGRTLRHVGRGMYELLTKGE